MRRLTRHAGIDTEPTWSPSGREIAFISDRAGTPHVYVMDAEGAAVRPLTSSGHNTQPRWSPKGDLLVYTTRQGTHDIWAVNADGSNPRRLTQGPGDNQGPTWAPNGRRLAFSRDKNLYVARRDGSNLKLLRRGNDWFEPSWSPDGRRIMYRQGAVYVLDLARGRVARIGGGWPAVWSPNGARIAWSGFFHGEDFVFVGRADGRSKARPLTPGRIADWR